MSKYYVKIAKPNFEPSLFFVGPYEKTDLAQTDIDEAIAGESSVLSDADIEVLTETKARQLGRKLRLRHPSLGDTESNLLPHMPFSTEDLEVLKTEEDEDEGKYETREIPTRPAVTNGNGGTFQKKSSSPAKSTRKPEEWQREVVIVTGSMELVKWLADQGIKGSILTFVNSADQIRGKKVIGILPYHLACEAYRIGIIHIRHATRDQRAREMTARELEEAGTVLNWYIPPKLDEGVE